MKRFIALDMTHPDFDCKVWIIYDQITNRYGWHPLGFDLRNPNYFVESPMSADKYVSFDECMTVVDVLNKYN